MLLMTKHDEEDHDRGLAFDLKTFERRKVLTWIVGASATGLLVRCGGTTLEGSDAATDDAANNTCVADPIETSGPYPADGTNTASGSTSNVLTESGIVRSDIRSSFLGSTTMASGVLVTITITLVDSKNGCAPLSGYAIYFWHCDNHGHYSLYTAPAESYLRGVQVTDANGQVTFTTFYPACYDGRWPHYHFEVFSDLAAATSGKAAVLTSQFCMPSDLCDTIYADATAYPSSASIFSGVSLATDNVFGDNTAAQISQQTPNFSGSASTGYKATALVAI
jgi:protocatechuate 3,4-dioxygenase beta subunit